MPRRLFSGLLLCYGSTFLAALAGSLSSLNAAGFYGELIRPEWAPPPWLFGPVWTALYLMMGTAAFLVWRLPDSPTRRLALRLFLAQLVLNAAWTWIFFTARSGLGATVEIAALWLAIGATAATFFRLHRVAAALLVPYWLWVTFAAGLTVACWRLNPRLL